MTFVVIDPRLLNKCCEHAIAEGMQLDVGPGRILLQCPDCGSDIEQTDTGTWRWTPEHAYPWDPRTVARCHGCSDLLPIYRGRGRPRRYCETCRPPKE